MIVDTSALIAVLKSEPGWEALFNALCEEPGLIITPVLVEFRRVTAQELNRPSPSAGELLDRLATYRITTVPFAIGAAQAAVEAIKRFGSGKGLAGPLNMLDLMVYGAAKATRLPILCTGKDFTKTDALIHPASRRDP